MIDTHCHLVDPQFSKDLEEVLMRARDTGIDKIINAGYNVETSRDAIKMSGDMDWLLPAIGVHPNEVTKESVETFYRIEELMANGKIIAIGETGLDYYHNKSLYDVQRELFFKHIKLAKKCHLPLLIHTRNSIDDAIMILKKYDCHCGVFHCFSGSLDQARVILDMGFYLGFGGILTFSKKMQKVFKKIPMNRIVLETDAPYLSPEGHRGKRNEPSYIIGILDNAAKILDMTPKNLECILDKNAATLFSLCEN